MTNKPITMVSYRNTTRRQKPEDLDLELWFFKPFLLYDSLRQQILNFILGRWAGVNKLLGYELGDQGSIPGNDRYRPQRPDQFWSSSSLLFKCYQWFPLKVKWLEREDNASRPSIVGLEIVKLYLHVAEITLQSINLICCDVIVDGLK